MQDYHEQGARENSSAGPSEETKNRHLKLFRNSQISAKNRAPLLDSVKVNGRRNRSPTQRQALHMWAQDGFSSASKAKAMLQNTFKLKPGDKERIQAEIFGGVDKSSHLQGSPADFSQPNRALLSKFAPKNSN